MQDNHAHALPYAGITQAEADILTANGKSNKQPKAAGKSTPAIFAANLFTLFNLLNVLLAAALLSVGASRNLLFMGVVISNTLIGTVQELRAKRTIDKLELLAQKPVEAIRDGKTVSLPIEAIVEGDLIILRQGDQLCADAEVISGDGALNESLLTGESEPVDKAPGDALLSGSFVAEGTLYARVTKVGAESYATQLTLRARAIKKPHSELMHSMRIIVRTVSAVLVPLGLILLYRHYYVLGHSLYRSVTQSVAAVLGMIPEGLVLLTSMALAMGVVRLGRKNALVQELYGIESLARVDVLCLDKTGTITEGSMAVSEVTPLAGVPQEEVTGWMNALVAALDDENATFAALRKHFGGGTRHQALHTAPFSSARKWSGATFAEIGSCVLGAAEFVLPGQVGDALSEQIASYARRGMRVLLLCHSESPIKGKALPEGLVPKAIIALSDVLRQDAAETFAYFAQQDVTLKVISGDNPVTVSNVALLAGLAGAERYVDASALDTPEKLSEAAESYTIFGRVTPEQKKDLVLALKQQGHTVGMVGDGVNDIPALKASDCSIAMAGGSDAARRVSQITLLDANFASAPAIVAEGRQVINNITRAASLFLVKTTFSFLISFLLVFIRAAYPFAPIQMTLISSFTVGIPSFFLALEPNNARLQGNFLHNVMRNALPGGLTVVVLILILFALSGPIGISAEEQSTLATFITFSSGLFALCLTCRPFTFIRALLVASMAACFFSIAGTIGHVFYLVPLVWPLWPLAVGLSALSVPLMLGLRHVVRMISRRREEA